MGSSHVSIENGVTPHSVAGRLISVEPKYIHSVFWECEGTQKEKKEKSSQDMEKLVSLLWSTTQHPLKARHITSKSRKMSMYKCMEFHCLYVCVRFLFLSRFIALSNNSISSKFYQPLHIPHTHIKRRVASWKLCKSEFNKKEKRPCPQWKTQSLRCEESNKSAQIAVVESVVKGFRFVVLQKNNSKQNKENKSRLGLI